MEIKYRIGIMPGPWPPGRDGGGFLWTLCDFLEESGIDSLWLSDRLSSPAPVPEVMTTLAAVAARTSRLKFGPSVIVLPYRTPVVAAKEMATIDWLSRGRLFPAVGVGVELPREFEASGVPFKERGRHADEILQIFKTLWTSDHPTFNGTFFRFDDVGFQPKPVQKPHPPIWVGGNSPAAFRRVVTYGDGWHATFLATDALRTSLDQLRKAADAAKRSFDTIELSMRVGTKGPIKDSRQAIIDQLADYKKLGLTHVMLDIRRDSLTEMLEALDVVTSEIRRRAPRASR